jgi:clathrin heavy chain
LKSLAQAGLNSIALFHRLLAVHRVHDAVELAAAYPWGRLRNWATLDALRFVHVREGEQQKSAVVEYLSRVLHREQRLNGVESVELLKLKMHDVRGMVAAAAQLLRDDRLECSEELGDILVAHDPRLALGVYTRANVPSKVIATLVVLAAQVSPLLAICCAAVRDSSTDDLVVLFFAGLF